jgi:hypothetical protein
MDQEKYQTTFLLAFLIVLIGALLLAWPSPVMHAGPGLPPRETPTPTRPSGDDDDGKPAGAHIILQVQSAPVEVWTVVQWQDSAGSWHDIEGWSGALDEGDQKVWWVAPKDFGTGPFRWLVYPGQGGKLLAQSELFYLPHSAGETVRIEVPLGNGLPLSSHCLTRRPMEAASSCRSDPGKRGYGPSSSGKIVLGAGMTSRGGKVCSRRAISKIGGLLRASLVRGRSAGRFTRAREVSPLLRATRFISLTLQARRSRLG